MKLIDYEQVIRNNIENDEIIFNKNNLPSDRLQKLIKDYLKCEQIRISNIRISSSDKDVQLVGETTLFSLDKIEIKMTFVEIEQDIQLTLGISLPSTWKFSQSFPDIKNTLFDKLVFSEAGLILSSFEYLDELLMVTVKKGLNFHTQFMTPGPFSNIQKLIGKGDKVTLSGMITHLEAGTEIGLNADIPFGVKLGKIDLKNVKLVLVNSRENGHMKSRAQISSNVVLGEKEITLTAQVAEKQDSIVFWARPKDISFTNLSNFNGITGALALNRLLPVHLRKFNRFDLSEMGIEHNLKENQVDTVFFTLSSPDTWEPIPGWLQVREVQMDWIIHHPFVEKDEDVNKIECKVMGEAELGNVIFEICAEFPDFIVTSNLIGVTKPDTLSIARQLLPKIVSLPAGLPQLKFDNMNMTIDPTALTFTLNGKSSSEWEIIPDLHSERDTEIRLQGRIPEDSGAWEISGYFSTLTKVADMEIAITGDIGDEFVLKGTLNKINLSTIAEKLLEAVALPAELPDLEFSEINVSIKPKTGEFSLSGKQINDWTILLPEGNKLTSLVDFALNRTLEKENDNTNPGKGKWDCLITCHADGPYAIVEGLVFREYDMIFELEENDERKWSISGDVKVDLFDKEFNLKAEYSKEDKERKLNLLTSVPSAIEIFNLKDIGSLSVSELGIEIEKETTNETDKKSKVKYSWKISANGILMIDNVINSAGKMTLFMEKDGAAGLIFTPDYAEAQIPLRLPAHDNIEPKLELSFKDFSILKNGKNQIGNEAEWSLSATVATSFSGLPVKIQKILPEEPSETQFKVDRTGAKITVDRLTNPVEFDIPDIRFNKKSITLGKAYIDISNLSAHFGKDFTLSAQIGIGLPAEMNNILGVKKDGSPNVLLFNTYDPAYPEDTIIKIKFTIDEQNILFAFLTSPIRKIDLEQENEITWWYCDLGDCGKIKFQVPLFCFNHINSNFEASGGFEIIEPLKIPFSPIKQFLRACKLEEAAEKLPDGLPIKEVKILDDQTNFNVDEFINLLEVAGQMPDDIKNAMQTIGNQINKLPDSLKQYLNISIPDNLSFDISMAMDGSTKFSLKTEGEPLKVLYPGLIPGAVPLPGLNGIELRSISFGPLMGGSLFLLEIDGCFDQFDIATLVSSFILPTDKEFPLPTSNEIQRRLILKKLFMLIFYQTAIPIPVPVFYDEIGIEYLGLEGIGLQAHAKFPLPEVTPSATVQFFSALKQFLTDPNYLLDPVSPAGGVNLVYTLENNYLQLPEYLGGGVLGNRSGSIVIDFYKNIAYLLNGLKTLSLNDIIQAIPLEYRVGNEQLKFLFLLFEIDWLISTPKEFKEEAYKKLNLTEEKRDDFVTVLPAVVNESNTGETISDEQGLVVFFRGGAEIKHVTTLEAVFGLAASGLMGFNTGFKFSGSLANLIEMELSGSIAINRPGLPRDDDQPAIQVIGHSHLRVPMLDHMIFRSDIRLAENRFWFKGLLDLFPDSFPVQVSGNLEGWLGEDGFYLAGDVVASISSFTLAGASAEISNNRLFLKGTLFDVSALLELMRTDDVLMLRGELDPIIIGDIFKVTGAAGNSKPSLFIEFNKGKVPTLDLSGAVTLLGITAETQIHFSELKFNFLIAGKLFDLFNCSIEVSGNNLARGSDFSIVAKMQNDLFQYLREKASQFIKETADLAISKLQNAIDAVNRAQTEVDRLIGTINNTRNLITKEREIAQQNLTKAQQEVDKAQNEVNRLLGIIRYKESERDRLSSQQNCSTIYTWVPTPTWRYPFAGYWRAHRICMPDPIALARAAGIQLEITALYVSYGIATTVLAVAKTALALARGVIILTPIDLDPRMVALNGAYLTATAALTVAREFLSTTQKVVGAAATIGNYIVNCGLGGLLDIRAAKFEANLSQAAGGYISMEMELVLMGELQILELDFNLKDPLANARTLARKLLPA